MVSLGLKVNLVQREHQVCLYQDHQGEMGSLVGMDYQEQREIRVIRAHLDPQVTPLKD